MGASSGGEAGRHYRLAWHDGLCLGPLDAYCALEAGTKMVWEGRVTASGAWEIEQPQLWGGEKDQGGVQGRIRVMFGEADQQPNAYLTGVFGDQTVAWRGIATVVWEGGRWGANNPNPQRWSHLVERIKAGWDNDECWYPETAPIPLVAGNEGEGGGEGVPATHRYNFGQRVIADGISLPGNCTVEMAEAYDWTYTPTDEAYWFWRPNESGITYVKFGGSDYNAVIAMIDLGWQVGETALLRFTSGAIGPVVLAFGDDPPAAPAGYGWTQTVNNTYSTSLGTVRLWVSDFIIGENNPSVGNDTSGRYVKNPAHIILEAHTASYHAGHPIETVNLDSLTAAADWYYAQGFGLGTARRPDKESPEEYIARIERVAGCSFTQSNEDGLWYLDIANGEYDLESLPILTDDDVLEFEEIATVLDDAVNSVSVKYFDPLRKEAITTRPLQSIALIAEFGENHQTYEFPEIPSDAIARRVRERESLATTTPTRAFNLVTTPKTRSWRKSTYFRLQLPKRGIADMVCIVAEGDEGKLASGACQFKATQDIYSLPSTVYGAEEPGVDTRPPATPAAHEVERVFEAPYIDAVAQFTPTEFAALAPDAGFAVGIAVNPGRMLDFTLAVDAGAGFLEQANGDYCATCVATSDVPPGQKNAIAYGDGHNLQQVEIGSAVLWDDEICRLDAIDTEAGTVDLGRGCADTVPALHLAGSRLWFYQTGAAVDPTEYTDGETIDIKLLPRTGSKQLADADAATLPLTFARRLARPYPPANLKLNGVDFFGDDSPVVPPPGTGGGGGGGGGGTIQPPAIAPNGSVASATLGPNGGYPDDGAPLFPPPDVFGADLVDDGGFDSPTALAGWRQRDGSPLGPEWSIVDGKLHFRGTFGVHTAYYFGARYSLPYMPFPRISTHSTADVQTDPNIETRIGVAWGTWQVGNQPSYLEASEAASYPVETAVSHDWTHEVTNAGVGFGFPGEYIVLNIVPVVQHTVNGYAQGNAWVDNVTMEVSQELLAPVTAETPANLDLASGLTGWALWPDPSDTNELVADVTVTGGVMRFEFISDYGPFRWAWNEDPLTYADTEGKYVRMGGLVLCNDDHVQKTNTGNYYTSGGVTFGLVYVPIGGGDPVFRAGGRMERGDFTLREVIQRVLLSAGSGFTHHLGICATGKPGTKCEVKDLFVETSDDVKD